MWCYALIISFLTYVEDRIKDKSNAILLRTFLLLSGRVKLMHEQFIMRMSCNSIK